MLSFRTSRYLQLLSLLLVLVVGLVGAQAVWAQEPVKPKPLTPSLELESKFPVLSGEATDTFQGEVEIKYSGEVRKRFDLTFTTPKDWIAQAVSSYPEKQIAAVELGPAAEYPVTEKITVKFAPIYLEAAEPGEHKITLEVKSGELKKSIDLTAKITAKYKMSITTETGKLNTEATAGKESTFTIKVENEGTVPLDDITFSASKPEGWTISFKPEKVDTIEPFLDKPVDVIIKAPSGKTIAGDYMITINAESKKAKADAQIRVTVLTPSIWGWVGIIIVLVVIAALAVIFRQLGRR